ncbi:hypothetical protein E2562_034355, partial [Oryza meyeriana var. granulata]
MSHDGHSPVRSDDHSHDDRRLCPSVFGLTSPCDGYILAASTSCIPTRCHTGPIPVLAIDEETTVAADVPT